MQAGIRTVWGMKWAGEVLRCDGVKGLFGLGRNGVWSALTMGKGGAWEGEGGMAQEA